MIKEVCLFVAGLVTGAVFMAWIDDEEESAEDVLKEGNDDQPSEEPVTA